MFGETVFCGPKEALFLSYIEASDMDPFIQQKLLKY